MQNISSQMNDAEPSRKDYVWKKNKCYMNPCANSRCKNTVLMKRSIADGWHVGVCNLCKTKQTEKDVKDAG